MAQKKQNLYLNISLNVNCWLYSLSSLFNQDEHDNISLTSHILMPFSKTTKY